MNPESLVMQFARMGADLDVRENPRAGAYTLDVVRDRFVLSLDAKARVDLVVPEVRPRERHLLLVAREDGGATKRKFLCGHDERHWFAATLPEVRGVTSVRDAMDALKPAGALRSQRAAGVRTKDMHRRSNAGFLRQGEWFFVPAPNTRVPSNMILRGEPISRPGGRPHILEEAFRHGGEVVWSDGRRVLSVPAYQRIAKEAKPPRWFRAAHWEMRRINASVFARGTVRHPDHATIRLREWHTVLMSGESTLRGGPLLFLD